MATCAHYLEIQCKWVANVQTYCLLSGPDSHFNADWTKILSRLKEGIVPVITESVEDIHLPIWLVNFC